MIEKNITIRISFLSTFDALVYDWIYHIIISITIFISTRMNMEIAPTKQTHVRYMELSESGVYQYIPHELQFSRWKMMMKHEIVGYPFSDNPI